jgi:hypothetical protein
VEWVEDLVVEWVEDLVVEWQVELAVCQVQEVADRLNIRFFGLALNCRNRGLA